MTETTTTPLPPLLLRGDCLEELARIPDESVDAVVTDPPYGLEFMGKGWDSFKGETWQSGAGFNGGGTSATKNAPSYSSEPNASCAKCGGRMRGAKPCTCAQPDFRVRGEPVRRGGSNHAAMLAFEAWTESWAAECLRILKPGGHLLAFGGSRTWHRLAAGIEDAGFEVRDSIAWLYGSGFPKSMDVSKAIDKLDAADERMRRARAFQAWLSQHMTPKRVNEITGTDMGHHLTTHPTQPAVATADLFDMLRPHLPEVPAEIEQLVAERTVESENFKRREVTGARKGVDTKASRLGFAGETYGGTSAATMVDITAPATDAAREWAGWGTALKPAFEPIVVARKPLVGTVAANVLAHGTGALNIHATRIDAAGRPHIVKTGRRMPGSSIDGAESRAEGTTDQGRWPANVVLDESQAAELDAQSGTKAPRASGPRPVVKRASGADVNGNTSAALGAESRRSGEEVGVDRGDGGGASRFFYVAKAPKSERPVVDGTAHPTVKPLALMRWLCRLVTPAGGVVVDPFAGSGTTLEAAYLEGFESIGVEMTPDYWPLVEARIARVTS